MSLVTLLLILALVCFLVEALRGNFARNVQPASAPRLVVGWGWFGLALVVFSWLVGPGHHVLD